MINVVGFRVYMYNDSGEDFQWNMEPSHLIPDGGAPRPPRSRTLDLTPYSFGMTIVVQPAALGHKSSTMRVPSEPRHAPPFNKEQLRSAIFYSHTGRLTSCPTEMARNMAILLMADLHPTGGQEIWPGKFLPPSPPGSLSKWTRMAAS